MLARSTAWPLADYKAALARLPETLQNQLTDVWGAPQNDPDCQRGTFHFAATRRGAAWIALQPEQDAPKGREDSYHDRARTPRHAYAAFYSWLQTRSDAMVQIGAHGTLEWLPGKSVALSATCRPEVLTGALPVIYPLRDNGTPERLARLEALLDEISNADGLDPRRRDRLQSGVTGEAQGVEQDLGLDRAGCSNEAITRIDRFVCDIKESQFGEGLRIWGRAPQGAAPFATAGSVAGERQSLLDALDGRCIAAGPSGSPHRRRLDVLPSGRNLFTTGPRAVPKRAAYAQGIRLADDLIRRHLQDRGDWPRGLIVDLWGPPQCAWRARSLPWRYTCWACGPSGMHGPSVPRASKYCRWPKWTVRALT